MSLRWRRCAQSPRGLVRSSLVVGLYSPTDSTRGGQLNQQIKDGVEGIIYGRERLETLDQVIAQWRSGGGDQMRAEYEEGFQKAG